MMTCHTPYLTDLPGIATENGEYAALCPDDARRDLRWCVENERRGIAWRYYTSLTYAEVADRIRRKRYGRQA